MRDEQGQWLELPSNAPQLADPELETVLLSRIIVGLNSHMLLNDGDDRNILVYPAHSSAPALYADGSESSNGEVNHSQQQRPSFSTSQHSRKEAASSLQDPEVQASLRQFEQHVKVANYDGHSFQEVCYRPSSTSSDDSECFSVSFPSNDQESTSATLLSLGLDASHPEASAFQQALATSSAFTDSKGFTYMPVAASATSSSGSSNSRKQGQDGLGLSFSAFPSTNGLSSSGSQYDAEESRSIKWMLYAGRAFIMRFYALAKVSKQLVFVPAHATQSSIFAKEHS